MKAYKQSFLVSCIIVSIPVVFLTIVSIVNHEISTAMFIVSGVMCLWWFVYSCLSRSIKHSFTLSFVLTNVLLLPLVAQTIRRIVFIIVNGGMERADGYGSPMAFLLGVIFEMFYFLPLSFTEAFGILIILKNGKEKSVTESENN